MARSSAISRLLSGLQRAPHDYAAPTSIFPNLNVDKLAGDMRLEELGSERGAGNAPPSDTQIADDVEHLIIDRVEAEKRNAHAAYSDQLQTYAERMTGLDFEGRFSTIRQAAPQAVSDFHAEAAQGRDQLFQLRRRIIDTERDREQFRARHNIGRSAHISTPGKIMLKIGILLTLALVEIVVNGAFLARGSEQGLLGGAVQAVSFALLNILVSFLVGLGIIRLANHRSIFKKMIGSVGVILYFSFAIALNLALSHYREISGSFSSEASVEVIRRFSQNPLGLSDLTSWIFLAIGFTFSVIAMVDGLLFRDPYPGYEAIEKACLAAHDDYNGRKAELIEDLRIIRDESSEAMNEAARDLSLKRGEFDSILQARARLNTAFVDFQGQLERAAQALLSVYREANRRARSTPAPARFGQAYALDRLPVAADSTTDTARDDLRKSIADSQRLLDEQVAAIHREFDAAVASYREIDELLPDSADGTTVKAA